LGLAEKDSSLPVCSECMGSYPCRNHKGSFPVWSFSHFRGPSRDLVHSLKYGSSKCLGKPMGRSMGEVLPPARGAVLVPVPLHKGSRRAFNQSREIAKGVAEVWKTEVMEGLAWRLPRSTQVGLPSSRRKSLPKDAMRWKGRSDEERVVVLVDDVCTTGATLRSAAHAVRSSGATVAGAIVWSLAKGGTIEV